jgi:ABC-type nitrate/sulfonate/bicarbonate transport system permease component
LRQKRAQTTLLAIGQAPLAVWKASGKIFRSIMGFAVFLTAWEVLASVGLINAVLLPSPTALFWAASDLLRSGTLFRHVSASIERVLVGFALASAG